LLRYLRPKSEKFFTDIGSAIFKPDYFGFIRHLPALNLICGNLKPRCKKHSKPTLLGCMWLIMQNEPLSRKIPIRVNQSFGGDWG